MQSLLRILPLFRSLDLEGLRDLPLTHPQTHKHSEKKLPSFFSFDLDNLWRWQGKNEPISLERSQNSESSFQLLSGQARFECVCVFFSVGFTYYNTLPVWNLCRFSGYLVCLFPRQVWTCFMLSIGVKTMVAASWQRDLLGLEQRHWLFRRLWGICWLWERCPAAAFTWIKRIAGSHPKSTTLIWLALKSVSPDFSELDYGALIAA